MAKKRMVTRTIARTEVEALCANKQAEQIETVTLSITGVYKDDRALVKAVVKALPDTYVLLSIKSATVSEKLYGMSEDDFIRNAVEIGKKRIK